MFHGATYNFNAMHLYGTAVFLVHLHFMHTYLFFYPFCTAFSDGWDRMCVIIFIWCSVVQNFAHFVRSFIHSTYTIFFFHLSLSLVHFVNFCSCCFLFALRFLGDASALLLVLDYESGLLRACTLYK